MGKPVVPSENTIPSNIKYEVYKDQFREWLPCHVLNDEGQAMSADRMAYSVYMLHELGDYEGMDGLNQVLSAALLANGVIDLYMDLGRDEE